jgi:hypothetical protein
MNETEILDRIGELARERTDLYAGAAHGGLHEHGLDRLHDLEARIDDHWELLRRCRWASDAMSVARRR